MGVKRCLKRRLSPRETINHETKNLDPVALCLALGGVREECAALMRGVAEAATSE